MFDDLSKSAQRVQDVLSSKGLMFKVVEFPAGTRTAVDAAAAINCEVAQIMKSLVFITKETKQPVLVLASGINKVDEKLIAKQVGENIVRADPDFVREVTGFAIGGVPPIGHKQDIKFIFIDEDLFTLSTLWAAAGTPNAVFSLLSSDIKNLIDGKIIAVH